MSKNKVLFGKDMVEGLKSGMEILHNAVAATMGAAGKNTLYRSDYSNRPIATNDGISIARRIALEDEVQAIGAELLTQAAERVNEEAGDGTTTAIVLTYAMINKGLAMVAGGVNPMILRKQMQDSVNEIVKHIKDIAIPIKTDEELFNIANISMENPEIAKLIAESVKKVGEDGVVMVEESPGINIERQDIDGLKFDKGYVTPYMASDPNTMEAIMEDVHVLVTDKSFQMNRDLFPLLEEISKNKIQKLFVICGGMQGEILSSIIANRVKGSFYCVVVDKPYDENVLEDIAVLVGAQNITNAKKPGDLTAADFFALGKAQKVIVTRNSTLIIGGAGDKKRIEERINVIKKDIKDTEHTYNRDRFKERLAKLTGGVIIIKVGASTEAEMKYLKLKVDDAVASTRAANQEGIIIGGGKTLFDFSTKKPINDGDEVVKYACSIPMAQIMKNAGFEKTIAEDEVFNALTGKVTKDPMKDGIIDPAKVERCALQNAVSTAAMFLTTESVIVDILKKDEHGIM